MILCVGCGGVGKTTVCAALGLAAARQGRRALCLTVDPARRLAQSLGLDPLGTEEQRVASELLVAAGLAVPGSLTLMMVDAKRTFDGLVTALARTPDARQRILENALYRHASTALAGTQEYAAMEKLHAVKDDPRYDLIVLDTPPTAHALDFLDAPQRLVDAIDSPTVRWFVQALGSSRRLSLGALARSAAMVLRGIGRITGRGLLQQVAAFITDVNDLFGSWRERADELARAMRGPDVAYVLVTTPDPLCVREVLFFARRLQEQGMRPGAYVVNRVHELGGEPASADEISRAIAARDLRLAPGAIPAIAEAARQEHRLAQLDRLHLVALEEAFGEDAGAAPDPLLVHVPEFPRDIHDLGRLVWVADVLAGQPRCC
ncbi:MAG: ArsA family ATPase [Deltaproteobacteria bacterium]|nr:ArsA family ATPase [Deltaproteobacteria bacterium]